MPDPIADPLHDPRVLAARARVTTVDRVRERFADPTAEVAASTQTATMRIYGRIDSDGAPWGISAQDVAQALDALPDDTTRLDVHIHSRGGDAFDGLAILNLLLQAKPEVHTHVDGLAASAASAIAMAGKTVTMAPSATLMMHDASGIGVGQAGDMRVLADALDSVSESYAAAYAQKTGVDAAQWRAAMQPETWYRADEAVTAKLADSVAATAPAAGPKPTASLDLSIFAYAGRDHAPQPFMPAAPAAPQTPAPTGDGSTTHEGIAAVAFTDEQLTTMRQQLGVASDADEATILAALGEALAESAADPPAATTPPPAAPPAGSVVVAQAVLDELRIAARAGQEARAVQLRQDRDDTISAAISGGYVSRDRRAHWTAQWDADPEGAQAALATLTGGEPLFPVGDAPGHGGSVQAAAGTYTDEMAAQDAELFGLPKEAFSR